MWRSTIRFFKEFGDTLAEAEKKGIFDDQADESKEEGQQEKAPVVTACPHCRQKGHEGEVCQLEMAMEFLNAVRVRPWFFYTSGSVRPFPCFFGWQVRMSVIRTAETPKIGKIGAKIRASID